jgi:23S rRNA (guanosine2251-2'-O)-methyltransferase
MDRTFRKLFDSELGRMDEEEFKRAEKLPVAVVLDNVRSANNVGSAFRSCDAFRMEKMVLCGITGRPPSADIHKTALGAEFSMTWEYSKSTVEAVKAMRSEGRCIVSVEQAEHSTPLQDLKLERGRSYAFIFGNEVDGVQQEVLDLSDLCVEIPQFGTKHSLNVSVSVGIVLWQVALNLEF